MRYAVLAVFDSAVDAFGRPIFAAGQGAARRSFCDEVNRRAADNTMHGHPGDFSLHFFGTFDDTRGVFDLQDRPTLVARGDEVVKGE